MGRGRGKPEGWWRGYIGRSTIGGQTVWPQGGKATEKRGVWENRGRARVRERTCIARSKMVRVYGRSIGRGNCGLNLGQRTGGQEGGGGDVGKE